VALAAFNQSGLHAQAPTPEPPAPPQGEVLFQSHGEPPSTPEATPPLNLTEPSGPELTDSERAAVFFAAYDLDARFTPATSGLSLRANLTIRNDGSVSLTRIALQISSTLVWQSASLQAVKLPLAQHLVDTDADHTGRANEAVITLPAALVPGASITLDTFYSGTLAQNDTRLTRIGATPAQALQSDWDAVSAQGIALRGFGNVLWYPVASPQLFLGDGAKLFEAIGAMRLREQGAKMRLRLSIEYKGDPPVAAFFCSHRQKLTAIPDDPEMPVALGSGIAQAEFDWAPLGFRLPNLFVAESPEQLIAPLPEITSSSAATAAAKDLVTDEDAPMLAVETTDDGSLPRLAASAQSIAPLLQQWFGARPMSRLTVLDHEGQPFEDATLLVAPVASLAASSSTEALAHSLAHAWVQTGQPWMDEGLAQFAALLWTEQELGRSVAVARLDDLMGPVALAEPAIDAAASAEKAPVGQPLIAASDEFFYRRKAAAVWWMLRGIAGDAPLQQALTAWLAQPVSSDSPKAQAIGFEKLLEKISGKDLGWFFNDWVLRDRGLPDLSIVDVEPRQLPAGKGHDSGWLVAVTVHNDGAPAVEVPVVIRSGSFSTTKMLHIDGFANATDRVLVEAPPTEVVVNDGGTPEVRTSVHKRDVVLKMP
jgi:hypothetical protein